MRIIPILICSMIFTFMAHASAFAENISFEAALDADRVAMGTAVQLILTIHGSQDLDRVDLPAIDNVEARYVGPSTQVSVINGEYSTSKSFTYMLVPLKEGKFTIPSVDVTVKGKLYQSQPVTGEVVPSSAPAQGAQESNALNDPQSIADRVKVNILTTTPDGYVNEEIPLVIRLYVRELPLQDISFPQITQEGFVLSDFARPKQYQETLNGKAFEVIEFSAKLTPTREGAVTIGPAVITGNLVIKNNVRRNSFGGNVFDDDFFNGFFNSYQKKPVTITSPVARFTAKPLPEDGKPADFSGGVGQFEFNVTAAPLKVKAGDPVTLKMSVSGSGDLKSIKMPVFSDSRFKVYDPQVKVLNGQKNMEQVVVPLKEGVSEIPAVSFSYFHTAEGKYINLVRGPFRIEVLPMETGQEFQAIGFSGRPTSLVKESFGNDIVFIKDRPGIFMKKQGWIGRNGWLLAILVVYINLWGLLFGVYFYRRKLINDPGFSKRSQAMRTARSAMNTLKLFIVEGEAKVFYSRLFNVFNDYIEKKMGILPGNADLAAVESAVTGKRIDKKKVVLLKELYDLAERARYASGSVSVADMNRSFLDMEEVLEAIERGVK